MKEKDDGSGRFLEGWLDMFIFLTAHLCLSSVYHIQTMYIGLWQK